MLRREYLKPIINYVLLLTSHHANHDECYTPVSVIRRNRSGDQSPQFFGLKSIRNSDLEKTHPDLRSAEANTVDPENLAENIPSIRKNVMMLEIDEM